jgi:Fe2+ transport system protein FeoA
MNCPLEKNVCLLSEVPAGQTVRLVKVDAGHGLTSRLAAMGLLANVSVEVLRNDFRGQLIVRVKNTKVVLGRGMAQKVQVR